MSEKIKTYDEIEEISKAMKAEGKRVGFVTGSFDLMHPGHCRYLQACKKECDFLIAAVSADAAITKRKGEMRPHNPQADRAELIANLESVDAVLMVAEQDKSKLGLLEKIKPNYYFKSDEFKDNELQRGYDSVGEVRFIDGYRGGGTARVRLND